MTIKNQSVLALFLFAILSLNNFSQARIEVVLGNLTLEENPNLMANVPQNNLPEIILSRPQYVLSYNKFNRVPNWVAWKLSPSNLGSSGRSNSFHKDSELADYLTTTSPSLSAVEQTEYKGSCFDRGHQVPSADRTDLRENNKMTFLMSNMTPQTPYLNRVIWAHLEQYTRSLVQNEGKTAFIIAGPIYDQDFGAIGPNNDIKIPSKSFKVIFIFDSHQKIFDTIAVVMPNTLQNGNKPMENKVDLCKPLTSGTNDKNDWEKYKTTLAEVEKLSGLQF